MGKFISFAEWKHLNPDLVEQLKDEMDNLDDSFKCPECYGAGAHTCSCGDYHDCERCNGTGRTDGKGNVDDQLRDIYGTMVNLERAKLSRWGKEPLADPSRVELLKGVGNA